MMYIATMWFGANNYRKYMYTLFLMYSKLIVGTLAVLTFQLYYVSYNLPIKIILGHFMTI